MSEKREVIYHIPASVLKEFIDVATESVGDLNDSVGLGCNHMEDMTPRDSQIAVSGHWDRFKDAIWDLKQYMKDEPDDIPFEV